jgi:hypothetical protein
MANYPLMDTLSSSQCFPVLFSSDRFIQAGITGKNSVLGEIR